jgi:hypothetical protein
VGRTCAARRWSGTRPGVPAPMCSPGWRDRSDRPPVPRCPDRVRNRATRSASLSRTQSLRRARRSRRSQRSASGRAEAASCSPLLPPHRRLRSPILCMRAWVPRTARRQRLPSRRRSVRSPPRTSVSDFSCGGRRRAPARHRTTLSVSASPCSRRTISSSSWRQVSCAPWPSFPFTVPSHLRVLNARGGRVGPCAHGAGRSIPPPVTRDTAS